MRCSEFEEMDLEALAEMTPAEWPCLKSVFQRYLDLENCFPFTIRREGKTVSVGSSIFLEKTAWIGHVIVHPDYQRQGLGRTMMQELLECINSRGIQTISLIATDMGFPLYRSLGFQLQQEYGLFAVPEGLQLEYNSGIEPLTKSQFRYILALDRRASGEDRGVFFHSCLQDAVGLRRGQNLSALFLPHAGEGVILADHPGDGLELMKYKMIHYPRKRISFPLKNTAALDFCLSVGCREVRQPRRMFLGRPFSWNPEMVFSRYGGFIG